MVSQASYWYWSHASLSVKLDRLLLRWYLREQELLRSPVYASAVEESLPRVVAHASSILEGVKERGEKAGDTMDSATEESLKPQVTLVDICSASVTF